MNEKLPQSFLISDSRRISEPIDSLLNCSPRGPLASRLLTSIGRAVNHLSMMSGQEVFDKGLMARWLFLTACVQWSKVVFDMNGLFKTSTEHNFRYSGY